MCFHPAPGRAAVADHEQSRDSSSLAALQMGDRNPKPGLPIQRHQHCLHVWDDGLDLDD
jgi:hypothetical protein